MSLFQFSCFTCFQRVSPEPVHACCCVGMAALCQTILVLDRGLLSSKGGLSGRAKLQAAMEVQEEACLPVPWASLFEEEELEAPATPEAASNCGDLPHMDLLEEGPPGPKRPCLHGPLSSSTSWVSRLQQAMDDDLSLVKRRKPFIMETVCSGMGTAAKVMQVDLVRKNVKHIVDYSSSVLQGGGASSQKGGGVFTAVAGPKLQTQVVGDISFSEGPSSIS